MTVKQLILEYLKSKTEWEFAGKVEDYIREVDRTKASTASRRMRELVNENKLERQTVNFQGKYVVQYRIKTFNFLQGIPAKDLDLYLAK